MRKFTYLIGAAFIATFLATPAFASHLGNGLPHGSKKGSYRLNVIAYETCPAGSFTGSNRHMIAVEADYQVIQGDITSTQAGKLTKDVLKTNTIYLASSGVGGDFTVYDGNACANRGPDGAKLALPITASNCDDGTGNCPVEDPTFTQYEVFVRLVGNPNNDAAIGVTTCANDDLGTMNENDDVVVCSTENVVKVRASGNNKRVAKFDNVSSQLLTLCLDTDWNSICDTRVSVFDPLLFDYFWQWNTNGRPHAQLVFIPVP